MHPTQRSRRIRLVPVFVSLLALMTVASASAQGIGEPIPAGDIRQATCFYSVVFYYPPTPAADTLATAKALTLQFLPRATFSDTMLALKPPYVGFEEEQAPLKSFPVPDASYFKYAGRGLTGKDIAAFSRTGRATRLVMVASRDDAWTYGRKFTELAHAFAEKTGAYVWDSATRECFSRQAWKEGRLATWPENGIPDVSRQITIHLYRPDDKVPYLRAITLGMEKFALPDVAVERLIGSDNRPGGNLINLVCQSLAENPSVKDGAKVLFSLAALKTESMRARMESLLEKGARREVALALLSVRTQEGDPDNRVIEIDFRHGEGKTEDERRSSLLTQLWGASDSVVGVKHSDDIVEASERARKRLIQVRVEFDKGLPPGSRLLVKAPFPRDDQGNEWMWVEVMRWPDEKALEGILQNDPFYIRALKAGANVKVNAADIFDYILYRADGTSEGNETGRLIQKQGGPARQK